MANAPYFPFPSAATYPPPIFPGGYSYPSPFPAPASGYFSTPAFPSAATYSHPHDIWSTPSTPSESPFPTPTSLLACGYSTAPGVSTFVHHQPPPPAPAYPYPPPTYAYTTSTAAPAYDHSTIPSTIHLTYSQLPPPPEITALPSPRRSASSLLELTIPTTASASKLQPDPALLLERHGPVLLRPELADPALSSPPPSPASDEPDVLASGTSSVGLPPTSSHPSSGSSSSPPPSGPDGFPQAPPPLAASMAAVAPAWPLYSGSPSSSLRPSGMPSYVASTILTEMEPVAVLSHSRLDSAPEVFDNMPTSRPGAEESIATAQARVVQAEATISKDMPRAVLDLKRRLDEQQARDRTSFDKLRGELAKLTSMASQLAVSIGKRSVSAPRSTPAVSAAVPACAVSQVFGELSPSSSRNGTGTRSPASTASMLSNASTTASSLNSYFGEYCAAPTPACDSVSVTHPSAVPSNRACVAQQVFCKMPTSSTTTAGSTTTRTSPPRHELLENSCVSNLSEQYLDEFPLHYGFDSLSRRSVFRADGSEHSYFTPPADYPLERVPAPVFDVYDDELDGCSNEFAQVFTGTPEQQPYEDAPQESEQSRKCFSRPSENPLPEVISEFALTTNVDVSVARYIKYKHGQCIPQVLEYSYTHDGAMGDVLLKEYKWNMLLSEEGREIWDPGTSVSTYPSWHPQLLVQQEGTVEHAPLQVHSRPAEIQPCVIQRAPAVTNCQVLDSALDMKFQQVPSVHAPSSIYLWLQRLTARITTEKPLSRVPIPEPTQWQSQVTSVSFVWDPGTRLLVHKSKWWFVYTEDMTNWYTNIKFNGVALWLFHSLPP